MNMHVCLDDLDWSKFIGSKDDDGWLDKRGKGEKETGIGDHYGGQLSPGP